MKFRVRDYAEAQGYSIRSLARRSGLAYHTVLNLWHDRTRRPDEETLRKLARVLNVADWRDLIAPDAAADEPPTETP